MFKASLLLLLTLLPAQAAITAHIIPVVSFELSGEPGPPVWRQVAEIHGMSPTEVSSLRWDCINETVITHIGSTHGYVDADHPYCLYERLGQVGIEPDAGEGSAVCTLWKGNVSYGSLMLDWWTVD